MHAEFDFHGFDPHLMKKTSKIKILKNSQKIPIQSAGPHIFKLAIAIAITTAITKARVSGALAPTKIPPPAPGLIKSQIFPYGARPFVLGHISYKYDHFRPPVAKNGRYKFIFLHMF